MPVVFVAAANSYVKDHPELSELMKVAVVVGPTVLYMNVVMGIYVYKAIRDPENYRVDPPVRVRMKPKQE